ncbi:hypothetical protein ACFYY8_33500 [Streptosporangium sp. NPDC001559]|uniref:hypothetical protein n=1 Tax=Streptosporangium sp. NPDC001559 TaxID=3366187 RepID=UPI0036EBDB4D
MVQVRVVDTSEEAVSEVMDILLPLLRQCPNLVIANRPKDVVGDGEVGVVFELRPVGSSPFQADRGGSRTSSRRQTTARHPRIG